MKIHFETENFNCVTGVAKQLNKLFMNLIFLEKKGTSVDSIRFNLVAWKIQPASSPSEIVKVRDDGKLCLLW